MMIDTKLSATPDWLRAQALTRPCALAVDDGNTRWTFHELDQAANRAWSLLVQAGAQWGDRIAWIGFPTSDAVALVHGVLRLGAILVPLDPKLTLAEIEVRLKDAEPRLILYDPKAIRYDLQAFKEIPVVPLSTMARIEAHHAPVPNIELNRICALIYTSGTTSQPKGALLRTGNFFWSAVFGGLHMGTDPKDRWLFVMPLFHVSGLSIIFRSVIHGSAIVMRSPFEANSAMNAMIEEQVSLASLVPTMLWRLLDHGLSGRAVPDLRMILLGGAGASPDLIERGRQSGLPIVPTYGLTETCSQVVTGLVPWEDEPPGSAGRPIFPTEIRIVDKDGHDLPVGQTGEILVSGPTVFAGYWKQETVSANTLQQGWLHTRDVGMLTNTGWVFIKDRLSDMIIRGAENIAPTEIENALSSHPAVTEAAVVGIPDEEWGEQIVAVLVTVDDTIPHDLTTFLQTRLARYKIPTAYFLVNALPRTPSGKIQRHQVRRQVQQNEVFPLHD